MTFGFLPADLERVSAHEAMTLAAGESPGTNFRMLDIRDTAEWETGHAPGAIHLPMYELATRMQELPESVTLLVVCAAGQRSPSVTARLQHAGYAVIDVIGGMDAWREAGGPIVGAAGASDANGGNGDESSTQVTSS